MKTTILITLLAALIGLSSCATTSGDSQAGTSGVTGSGVKPYPKDVCIVTGNKLGSMGDPVTMNHKGQEVKFCCKPCVKKFQADPDKYLASL